MKSVDGKNRRQDHGRSQNSERWKRVERWTHKRSSRARELHESNPELSNGDKGSIGINVVFTKFFPPSQKPKTIYADISKKHHQSLPSLQWSHDASTLHRAETNGVAERAVCRVKEETAIELVQKADCHKNGETVRWNATVIWATWRTRWPMTRQHSKRFLASHLTDHQSFLDNWLGSSKLPWKRSEEDICFERRRWKEYSLGYVPRAGGGWSGDLMIAGVEELQQSDPQKFTSKRFRSQEVFVKGEYEFPCSNRTPRRPSRPRPCLLAEGNLELEDGVEIEEGDKMGGQTEQSWSISGESIDRHHEEPRLKFYDSENETFPIPLKCVDAEHVQCLWRCYQWFMDRSEGCHSFWGADWEYKIPDPTCKTLWRIQVGRW